MNSFVLGIDEAGVAIATSPVAAFDGSLVVVESRSFIAEPAIPAHSLMSRARTDKLTAVIISVATDLKRGIGSPHTTLVPMAGFALLAVSIPVLRMTDKSPLRAERSGEGKRSPLQVENSATRGLLTLICGVTRTW